MASVEKLNSPLNPNLVLQGLDFRPKILTCVHCPELGSDSLKDTTQLLLQLWQNNQDMLPALLLATSCHCSLNGSRLAGTRARLSSRAFQTAPGGLLR